MIEFWDEKYRPYQIGCVQDRHGALNVELDTLIHFFIPKKERKKLLSSSFQKKNYELEKRGIIQQDLYKDLDRINRARHEFVKSAPLKPNEEKIRQLLNNVTCLWWDEKKRNKYDVYRLLLIGIMQCHSTLLSSSSYKKYFNAIFDTKSTKK